MPVMARKARAAICRTHNQPITVEEISVDPPKRGEVTVRLAACGVCHSDLSAITGTIALPLPLVLGHEGAGVVEAVGEGVADLRPGDHVIFSFIYMCGKCRFCVSGRPVLCLEQGKALTTPLEGSPRVHDASGAPLSIFSGCGAMAEYATVSAENLIKIDSKIPLECAALVGCAVTTGVGAVFNTAKVEPGSSVAVFGCGGVGLSAVLGAVAAGADPIVAVDVAPERIEAALRLGATDAVEWAGGPDATAEQVRAVSGGGVDYAIEATGRPEASRAAFLSTRARGAAVLIGIPPADAEVSLPALSIPRLERRVLGSIYGSSRPERDFPALLSLYRRGRLPLDRLIASRMPLDAVGEAFGLMRDGGVGRVVLDLAGAPV